ncbi:PIG-L deacetylase family protein [Virgibacillus ndiopensis]|uniref:PIG-L deacetylase family protein n=1 Tax=Virgibacillus ndiopensis TaxID=2004408 RepID=UPI000C06FDB5|nr:PIG-L deacetylase family protein [Virgibacillus ndiopensis]
MDKNTNLLVVSAHAADFVWRGGGTIAKYIKNGANVTLIILSYGVRGESNDLWKMEDQSYENVKNIRRKEIDKATDILGINNVEFWDFEDYHMVIDEPRLYQLVRKIREIKPDHILTHAKGDAFNPDHELVSQSVFKASVLANSSGVQIEGLNATTQQRLFGFEPHQTEISNFTPEIIIDITETYDQKKAAMQCFEAQPHLIDYYDARAKMRGNHARRISGNKTYKYAEAFTRFYPHVGSEFV